MRSPLEITCGLLALFARTQPRARRLLRNNKACTSLIGQCTSSSTSPPRVVGCAGTARLSRCCKQIVVGCRHFVGRNKVVRHRTLFERKLHKVISMNNNRSRAVGNTSPSTNSTPKSNGDNLPPPNVLHGRPIPTTPVGFVGPYWGLGLPNRGAFGQVQNPMAARCPRRGPRGGRGTKRGYQPRTCGLCGHDRVYNS